MQIYESLCVCAIIAGASGAIGRACARLEISPFALAFSGALLLMLSRFSFAPLAEFRCNTGTLVFPVYFLIQMVEQRGLNVRAAATWRAFLPRPRFRLYGCLRAHLQSFGDWIMHP